MSQSKQSDITEYTAGTETQTLTKTVQVPLETSNRKSQRVRECIDEWQEILSWSSDIMPSIPPTNRSKSNPDLYTMMNREFPDHNIHSQAAKEAVYKPAEAYKSRDSNNHSGDRPRFDGSGNYMQFSNQGYELAKNNTGYGLKVKLEPYDPEWFHIDPREYHIENLSSVVNDRKNRSLGSMELVINDNGSLVANIVVNEDIEVYRPDNVETTVGVDVGERVIYTCAVVSNGLVESVDMESGSEFRHYREQLQEKRKKRSEKGDLAGVRECRGDIERYTDQVINTATRQIIDVARNHTPCVIQLEDMGDYRETAENPSHDWPRGMVEQQIRYKATEQGIPVNEVNPAYTSTECRKCGHDNQENRVGTEFHCLKCGYQVHADVNAAINIAQR